MMKFIIVEDGKLVQDTFKQILRKLSIKNNQNLEVQYFSKYCKELQKEIDTELYRKVYIMDIELEDSISGLEIADKIREKDWDSEIIFVTKHDQLFESAHRKILDVFDFIEKFDDMEQRLENDIQKIFNKKIDSGVLKLSGKFVELEIYMKNILYITRDKEERKSIIHTEEVQFKVGYSLTELLKNLDSRFVQTHKSCIANKTRMAERNYSKGYFILDNGIKVDLLSKKFRKEIEKVT